MVALAEQLTGEIPGLLQHTSPVIFPGHQPKWWHGPTGVVVHIYEGGVTMLVGSVGGAKTGIGEIRASRVRLDTSHHTGRFHCRLWLAEQGHDVGGEDRADVLAWSVLSVWRGGHPLRVAGPWDGRKRRCAGEEWVVGYMDDSGWWMGGEHGPETGEAGRAACDAAILAIGCWALTNDDGSLTLPPLPGGAQ